MAYSAIKRGGTAIVELLRGREIKPVFPGFAASLISIKMVIMRRSIIPIVMAFLMAYTAFVSAEQFTTQDRERIVRLETNVEAGTVSIQRQLDDIKSFMFWGFGVLFGGMGILIGFVIWDRRTALEPVAIKTRELLEREEKLERALREYAKKEPKLAAILRSLNL